MIAASLLAVPSSGWAQGYFVGNRWTTTAQNEGMLLRGDATNLTWGFVPDSTNIRGGSGEAASPSNLIDFLDTNIGSGSGGGDYTNRPWFSLFQDSYDRWGEVSGLSFSYESNDDGVTIRDNSNHFTGELNTRADMRIGGHSIDGQAGANTLAYNYYPDHGDMVIDTDNSEFYGDDTDNYFGMRNVLMHEIGHGIGIHHMISNDSNFLLEPFFNVAIDGPQFADILAAQRLYGDSFEKGVGNDTSGNATDLGTAENIIIGTDASDTFVEMSDIDFVSIDGSTDTDFFKFTISGEQEMNLLLTPLGQTYHAQREDGSDSNTFDAASQNDLTLTLLDTDGSTILETSNMNGLGGSETITRLLETGTYYARITGANDEIQFYEFGISVASVPEPAALATLSLISIGAFVYHRRRKQSNNRGKTANPA
jgi:hypothetical protein